MTLINAFVQIFCRNSMAVRIAVIGTLLVIICTGSTTHCVGLSVLGLVYEALRNDLKQDSDMRKRA